MISPRMMRGIMHTRKLKLATIYLLLLLIGLISGASAQNNGTLVGSPSFVAAKFSNGVSLNGTSQWITVPGPAFAHAANASWTWECWAKTAGGAGVHVVMGGQGHWLGMNGGVAVASVSGLSPSVFGTQNIADNLWHHLALVVTAGTSAVLYVDGVASGAPTGTESNPGTSPPNCAIGSYWDGSSFATYAFPGIIDEAATWNVKRYAANFTPNTAAYTGAETGLVALYHLEASALDSVGAAAAASFTTSPTTASTSVNQTESLVGANTHFTAGMTVAVTGGTGASAGTVTVVSPTSASFTLTPGSAAGTLTLTPSTDTGATATITVTGGATGTFPVTSANIYFSPYNWFSVGGSGAMSANNTRATGTTSVTTQSPGAYMKIATTGSPAGGFVRLGFDPSGYNTLTAANCPVLCWSEDGGTMQSLLLVYNAAVQTLTLDASTTAGAHTFQVWFKGTVLNSGNSMGDRWNYAPSGPNAAGIVKILNVQTDAGTTLAAPIIQPNILLVYGDSITEGADTIGSANGPNDQDSTVTYGFLLAQALNAEVGIIGFSSQGYEQPGYGNVPAFPAAWSFYNAGNSRLIGGLLAPAPTHIVVAHGRNGATIAADVTGMATSLRNAAPSANIFFAVSPNQAAQSVLASAVATARGTDTKVYLADPGVNMISPLTSNDTIHPNERYGQPRYGAAIAQAIQSKLGGTNSVTTVLRRRIN